MNIYFLLEGRRTEKKVYRAWLNHLIPRLTEAKFYNRVEENNFFLLSLEGYPSVINDGIPLAIEHIQETQKYQYLVICLDADEDSVNFRKNEIDEYIKKNNLNISGINIVKIIQNRCIETWFLGNRKIFNTRQPKLDKLQQYFNYYDVCLKDPELMGNYNTQYNHAQFHELYLVAIFKAKGLTYSKKRPGIVLEKYYLKELQKRILDNRQHLKTFQSFISFCQQINLQLPI